jgi:cytochrome b
VKIRVWDLPTRLFHWCLVVAVGISFYTGLTGNFIDYHMLSGYSILGLLLFRLGWGFVGGQYSRFTQFVPGPRTLIRYLASIRQASDANHHGHNPIGALSVVAMLVLLLGQAVTGMFANDDIMLEGPLAHLVSYDTSRSITSIHKLGKYMIGALVLTHIAAIVFYLMRKKNLILPMITGNKTLSTDSTVPTEQPGLALELLKAMLVGASAGLIVYLLVNFS